jgi:hypothetical protein
VLSTVAPFPAISMLTATVAGVVSRLKHRPERVAVVTRNAQAGALPLPRWAIVHAPVGCGAFAIGAMVSTALEVVGGVLDTRGAARPDEHATSNNPAKATALTGARGVPK